MKVFYALYHQPYDIPVWKLNMFLHFVSEFVNTNVFRIRKPVFNI